jgi:hypothetical protein
MPGIVDIANAALAHLGDEANVQSIMPPDGSVQAVHCARFLPIARDSLLEMHDWNFATRRIVLSELVNDSNQWLYAYAAPTKMICARKVMDENATDDWSMGLGGNSNLGLGRNVGPGFVQPISVNSREGVYTPIPYVVESLDDGTQVIRTNQCNALLMYTIRVEDPTKWSPLFCDTLGRYLASYIAGPIIKGQEGRAVAADMLKSAMGMMSMARASDANQRRTDIAPAVSWMVNR